MLFSSLSGTYYLFIQQQEELFRFFNAQSLVYFSQLDLVKPFVLFCLFWLIYFYLWIYYGFWGGMFWFRFFLLFLLYILLFLLHYWWLVILIDFSAFNLLDVYLPLHIPHFLHWWYELLFLFFLHTLLIVILFLIKKYALWFLKYIFFGLLILVFVYSFSPVFAFIYVMCFFILEILEIISIYLKNKKNKIF
jgi:hypothetical protein